jgi:hypothetical protein
MKVYNLCCELNHHFEGWFRSEADFQSQLEHSQVACPVCESVKIMKLPSAPRLNLSHPQTDDTARQQQAALMALTRKVLTETEDVGENFAREARRIFYQDAPARPIRGLATHEERAELAEEGINAIPFGIPAVLKETLQ